MKYILYSHSFIPNREKLAERKAKDKVDYDAWERMGFITVTDTPIVDQNAVMQYASGYMCRKRLELLNACASIRQMPAS
ncbi:MAG: hypothetical protein ACLS61_03465 [Ruminococcus sp.]